MRVTTLLAFLLFTTTFLAPQAAFGQAAELQEPPGPSGRLLLEIEAGPVLATRNDVQIPPDAGTRFSLLDTTGRGAWPFARIAGTLVFGERHAVKIVAAPVRQRGTATLDFPVFFVDRQFAAGVPTEGSYQFDTYRMGYRYSFRRENWRLQVGGAVLVRDASIELRQGPIAARDTDLGLVPLASFAAERRLGDRTSVLFDVDGLGAPQGRAIDALLKFNVRMGDNWWLGAGYRTIEGGADVESVFTFAWIHFGVVSAAYRF
jgi:hypothetical protein